MTTQPVIGMIHNHAQGTFHPVVYLYNPLPGPPEAGKPSRHKSKMHHTTGFATRVAALENAKQDLAPRVEGAFGIPVFCLDEKYDLPWDGRDIPADVAFFLTEGEQVIRM